MATGTMQEGIAALRSEVERIAQDPSIAATDRLEALTELRQSIEVVLGACDTYIASIDKRLQAQEDLASSAISLVRENASLRSELLHRGLATEQELDEAGMLPAGELDRLDEEGLLEAWAVEYTERLHPRNRRGKWIEKLGGPDVPSMLRDGQYADYRMLQRARRSGDEVAVVSTDRRTGEVETAIGWIKSMGEQAITIEDADGRGHRVKWDEVTHAVNMTLERAVDARPDPYQAWRKFDTDRSKWTPPPGVTYSPEVQAIDSPQAAMEYLRSRGVEGDLTPAENDQGRNIAADADFFRQIAQAVTDAQDRYPILREGPVPLKGVSLFRNIPHGGPRNMPDEVRRDVWGVTAMNGGETAMGWENPDWTPWDSAIEPKGVWIALNDRNQTGFQSRSLPSSLMGGTAKADLTPYGRMMHELGHATYSAGGFSRQDFERWEAADDDDLVGTVSMDFMEEAGIGPEQAGQVSGYGSTSPNEAWAELFATVNTPGAMDDMPWFLREMIADAQVASERRGVKVL